MGVMPDLSGGIRDLSGDPLRRRGVHAGRDNLTVIDWE
jgi:hypothetical protein